MPNQLSPDDLAHVVERWPVVFVVASADLVCARRTRAHREEGVFGRLDLLLVTPVLSDVWAGRTKIGWERGEVWAVSREGLVALKRLRGSGQDQDDIKRLQEDD